jgi:DNA-binding beta-propeller fold protein YncE
MIRGSKSGAATTAFGAQDGSGEPCVCAGLQDLRAARRRLIAALCVLAGGLMLWSAPALALSQRGHVFSFSFGAKGTGEGQFSSPTGIAVHEVSKTSDEVWVVDRPDHRVELFKCAISETEHSCVFALQVTVPSPQAIAVDNTSGPSSGDVYVTSTPKSEKDVIYKFTAAGEKILTIKAAKEGPTEIESLEESLRGVAVDSSGSLWVYHAETITKLSHAEKNQFASALAVEVSCPLPGLAVAPKGEDFFVSHEHFSNPETQECPSEVEGAKPRPIVAELSGSGESLVQALDGEPTTAAAVEDSELSPGTAYLDHATSVAAISSSRALVQRFGEGHLKEGGAIAVDSVGETVYVADSNEDTIAVFLPEPSGPPTVDSLSTQNFSPTATELKAQIDPHGADTHYYFQYGTVNCATSPGSCTDVPASCPPCIPAILTPPGPDLGSAFGDQAVSVQLQNLQPGTTYFYRVIATNAHGEGEGAQTASTFTTLPSSSGLLPDNRAWEMVSPPEKDGSGIEPLGLEGGLAQASEDGSAITYVANGPVVPEPEGNRSFELTQLMSTRNSKEWAPQDIVTPHNKGEGFEVQEAPEYRAFSTNLSLGLVQPPSKALEPLEQPPLAPGAKEKTVYLRSDAPISPAPETEEEALYNQAKQNGATEHPPGYLPLVTEGNVLKEVKFGGHVDFVDATPDLSHVLIESTETKPLTPEAKESESGLYEWSAGQLHLVDVLPNGLPETCVGGCHLLGAVDINVRHAISNEGSRVFWTGANENHLYMRVTASGHEETIRVNPPLNPPPVEETEEEESEHGIEKGQVGFQTASKDGSRVFFTDTSRLTEESKLEPIPGLPNPADLYVCEVIKNEITGKLECKLTDLTVDHNVNENAAVRNVIPGASEDGTAVYFVANGSLVTGVPAGNCSYNGEAEPPGTTCNLYVEHYSGELGTGKWEAPKLIATLSNEDSGDWGSVNTLGLVEGETEPRPGLADVTSRVSPNGRYLAFMSDRSLTAYDNIEVHSGKPAEEVYLYDSGTGRLVCASCNPSGAPPVGVFDTHAAGEGQGLLVDRREDWKGQWLAGSIPGWTSQGTDHAYHQPRYLSDSGRLLFNSADALVPQAAGDTRIEEISGSKVAVGVENVYEYEPKGEGSCTAEGGCVALISSGTSAHESAFIDASTSGGDAFFVTAQPLVSQDRDTNFDLYDARVCSGASPCLQTEASSQRPCETTNSCRPQGPPPPSFAPPASATSSGSGNVAKQETLPIKVFKPAPLTRAQKLAKALKACKAKYKKNHKKRAACESQARKKYKAKRAKKAHNRSSGRRR